MRSDKNNKKRGFFGRKKTSSRNADFLSRRSDEDIQEIQGYERMVTDFKDLEELDRNYELKNKIKPSKRARIKASTLEEIEYLAARRSLNNNELYDGYEDIFANNKDSKYPVKDRVSEFYDQYEDKRIKDIYSNKNKYKNKKNISSKKNSNFKKVCIVTLILIATICAGFYFYLDTKLSKVQKVNVPLEAFKIDPKVANELSDYRNVLILGIDARKHEGFKGTRSDAIIIASINKSTNKVKLVSIMRDSLMPMKHKSGFEDLEKITHAHAFGGAINTCQSINRSLDLNISEFVVMNWKSVVDTVDSVGGITLDIQSNELRDLNKWGPETARNTDRKWKPIWKTGPMIVDGVQAATYCRIRKTSGGDPGRTNRMKKVIVALLKKVKDNPLSVDHVLDKVLPEIQTNMGTNDILSLAPHISGFEITDNISWPYDYYGGIFKGTWLAIPRTLEKNVVRLHSELFNQKDYKLSTENQKINKWIISETGIQ